MRRWPPLLLSFGCLGCLGSPALEPQCEELCLTASALMSPCLTELEQSWENTIWLDENNYLESCNTWSWEMSLIARSADAPNNARELLAGYCEEQNSQLATNSCEDLWALDWTTEPWLQ
jgi:hypothetical protein